MLVPHATIPVARRIVLGRRPGAGSPNRRAERITSRFVDVAAVAPRLQKQRGVVELTERNDWEVETMTDRIVEKHVVHEGSGAGSAMGALAVIVAIVAIVAVLYFSGAFHRLLGPKDTNIDININK